MFFGGDFVAVVQVFQFLPGKDRVKGTAFCASYFDVFGGVVGPVSGLYLPVKKVL